MLNALRGWAQSLRREIGALFLAARDPRTPPLAKAVALAVAVYALSPIDLIPDFIPVLGYLDDLLLVPLGIALAVWLVPDRLMQEFRAEAAQRAGPSASPVGAAIIVAIWLLAAATVFYWLL